MDSYTWPVNGQTFGDQGTVANGSVRLTRTGDDG